MESDYDPQVSKPECDTRFAEKKNLNLVEYHPLTPHDLTENNKKVT